MVDGQAFSTDNNSCSSSAISGRYSPQRTVRHLVAPDEGALDVDGFSLAQFIGSQRVVELLSIIALVALGFVKTAHLSGIKLDEDKATGNRFPITMGATPRRRNVGEVRYGSPDAEGLVSVGSDSGFGADWRRSVEW
jgi:hypothetical protein